ncbi:hypothetical protein [Roseicella aerolata]|uniref:Uncharacterized protein n=1 Tax=Roseicella aerolata TaxID=2883479 RepID=A0A9X1I9Q6_9PROT|nr:hypothetical protein [Roseicella aerolata]MCB4820527.1 hypothetical protein [Roseicella aerolata]
MAGFRIRLWFDPDGLNRGEPAYDDGVVVLPVIPVPGMEIRDSSGQIAVVQRVVLLTNPGPDGAVAAVVCSTQ